jgi:hypothetical protein
VSWSTPEFLGKAFEIYSDVHAGKEARVLSPRGNLQSERWVFLGSRASVSTTTVDGDELWPL